MKPKGKATKKAAKKTSTAQPSALVALLLDRSSSMTSCKDSTIEAVNGYIAGLREDPGIRFSLIPFCGNNAKPMYVNVPVEKVEPITAATYRPEDGGMTPLIDATVKTIQAMEKALADYPVGTKAIITIQTDGGENASCEYRPADLTRLIEEKQGLGWQILFAGTEESRPYDQAARYGISARNTVSYDSLSRGATRSVFTSMASNSASFASGSLATAGFNDLQKEAAGDKEWAKVKSGLTSGINGNTSS